MNQKSGKIILVLAMVLTSLASVHAEAGGVGTTGGGNIPEWMSLMPNRIEAYSLYQIRHLDTDEYREGICSHPDWKWRRRATHVERVYVFDRSDASGAAVRFDENWVRRNDRIPVSGYLEREDTPFCIGSAVRLEFVVDGQRMNAAEAALRLYPVLQRVLSEVQIFVPDTWGSAHEYDLVFQGLISIFGVNRQGVAEGFRIDERRVIYEMGQSIRSRIESEIVSDQWSRSNLIRRLLSMTVNREGQCDYARFVELRARMRADLSMPNSPLSASFYQAVEAFDRTLRESAAGAGPYLGSQSFDLSQKASSARDLRRDLLDQFESEVRPACAAFEDNSVGELRFDDDRAPVQRRRRRR